MGAYIQTSNSITIFHDGNVVTAQKDHPQWDKIVDAIKQEDFESATRLVDTTVLVKEYMQETDVSIEHGQVIYQGKPIHNALTRRILQMHAEGFNPKPMLLFLANLERNPSYSSREDLYRFLEANELPITEDGCFMAYKKIRENWNDVHSNTISNRVGTVVKMPRTDVDDNSSRTCSAGLHVCSKEYLRSFGGDRLVAVKVNPRDVVSVPHDYNNSKMRVCEYTVVTELSNTLREDAWDTAVVDTPKPTLYVAKHTGADLYFNLRRGFQVNLPIATRYRTKMDAIAAIKRHMGPYFTSYIIEEVED